MGQSAHSTQDKAIQGVEKETSENMRPMSERRPGAGLKAVTGKRESCEGQGTMRRTQTANRGSRGHEKGRWGPEVS
jgi:hypothetical protein